MDWAEWQLAHAEAEGGCCVCANPQTLAMHTKKNIEANLRLHTLICPAVGRPQTP